MMLINIATNYCTVQKYLRTYVGVFPRSWQNFIIGRISVLSNDAILQRFKLAMVHLIC